MASSSWALPQLSHILPLDEQSLQEILDYTSTLSKDASAEHLRNLLGTSPKALEFISSYNSRREAPKAESMPPTPEASAVSKKPRKKKQPLNKPFNSRQPDDYGNTAGGYNKRNEEDYVSGRRHQPKEPALANTLALSDKPDARQLPLSTPASGSSSPKKPPSASGPLISDLPNVRTGSRTNSRTSSPAPKTKVNVAGGTSMHGASSTLQDLDSAIRALEIQTNPSLTTEPTPSRACSCNATRHPLLAAAPNCLSCGKIICVKEGIGPCTFCSQPLLSPPEINAMIRALREERGKEKMSANNATHRRAEPATAPRPFASNGSGTPPPLPPSTNTTKDPTLAAAQQHRDKLLTFQAENARRTHIIDEAADYDTPVSGQNIWASPVERAKQLKRQQKVLREQEWNARPEWEKRRVVVSLDVVGGKAVRRMGEVERPREEEEEEEEEEEVEAGQANLVEEAEGGKGAFSRNPLMGGLIRPVWKGKGKGSEEDDGVDGERKAREKDRWRRVQDDNDDNEAWILDGGVYGGTDVERRLGGEEHAFG
ncbi:MAG: hypothetical protein LQ338_002872 [Usnochroma carphineum]|nr:MAG: hypothetical protein LQ338_002872 [Usnochroma carphineum]